MGDLSKIETGDGRDETRRAVQEQLGTLQEVIDRPDVIEVVINRPGEIWVETRQGWETLANASMTFVQTRTPGQGDGRLCGTGVSRRAADPFSGAALRRAHTDRRAARNSGGNHQRHHP